MKRRKTKKRKMKFRGGAIGDNKTHNVNGRGKWIELPRGKKKIYFSEVFNCERDTLPPPMEKFSIKNKKYFLTYYEEDTKKKEEIELKIYKKIGDYTFIICGIGKEEFKKTKQIRSLKIISVRNSNDEAKVADKSDKHVSFWVYMSHSTFFYRLFSEDVKRSIKGCKAEHYTKGTDYIQGNLLCMELQTFIYKEKEEERIKSLPKLYQHLHDTSALAEMINNPEMREITDLDVFKEIKGKSKIDCGRKNDKNGNLIRYNDFILNIEEISDILANNFNILEEEKDILKNFNYEHKFLCIDGINDDKSEICAYYDLKSDIRCAVLEHKNAPKKIYNLYYLYIYKLRIGNHELKHVRWPFNFTDDEKCNEYGLKKFVILDNYLCKLIEYNIQCTDREIIVVNPTHEQEDAAWGPIFLNEPAARRRIWKWPHSIPLNPGQWPPEIQKESLSKKGKAYHLIKDRYGDFTKKKEVGPKKSIMVYDALANKWKLGYIEPFQELKSPYLNIGINKYNKTYKCSEKYFLYADTVFNDVFPFADKEQRWQRRRTMTNIATAASAAVTMANAAALPAGWHPPLTFGQQSRVRAALAGWHPPLTFGDPEHRQRRFSSASQLAGWHPPLTWRPSHVRAASPSRIRDSIVNSFTGWGGGIRKKKTFKKGRKTRGRKTRGHLPYSH